jgi:2-polyprenyl-6-hydroxyphenyl methylase/3-demethylubiquinone-9 3-methyltransferase
LPRFAQSPFAIVVMAPFEVQLLLKALIAGQPCRYFRNWTDYQSARGMDHWHDTLDWVGGYPFEVATRPELIAFCARSGFPANRVEASKGLACNQLVFTRID